MSSRISSRIAAAIVALFLLIVTLRSTEALTSKGVDPAIKVTITPGDISGVMDTVHQQILPITVSICDSVGVVTTPSVQFDGAQMTPTSVATVTRTGCHSAMDVVYTVHMSPGAVNAIYVTASDGARSTYVYSFYWYDEADLRPQVTRAVASERVAESRAWADTFTVHNAGPIDAVYTFAASCPAVAIDCTLSTASASVSFYQTIKVAVSYTTSATGGSGTVKMTATHRSANNTNFSNNDSTMLAVDAQRPAITIRPGDTSGAITTVHAQIVPITVSICDDNVANMGSVTFDGAVMTPTSIQNVTRAGCVSAVDAVYTVHMAPGVTNGIYVTANDALHASEAHAYYSYDESDLRPVVTATIASERVDASRAWTDTFTVRNPGPIDAVYAFTATCSAVAAGCVASPANATISFYQSIKVAVSYTTSATDGFGSVQLTATHRAASNALFSDSGSTTLSVGPQQAVPAVIADLPAITVQPGMIPALVYLVRNTGSVTGSYRLRCQTVDGDLSFPNGTAALTSGQPSVWVACDSAATDVVVIQPHDSRHVTLSPKSGPNFGVTGQVILSAIGTNSDGSTTSASATTFMSTPQSGQAFSIFPSILHPIMRTVDRSTVAHQEVFTIANVGTSPDTIVVAEPSCGGFVRNCHTVGVTGPIALAVGGSGAVAVAYDADGGAIAENFVALHVHASNNLQDAWGKIVLLQGQPLASVVVSPSSGQAVANANSDSTVSFTLTNLGASDRVAYTVTCAGVVSCTGTLSGQTGSIAQNATANVSISYHVQAGTGGTGTISLDANTLNNSSAHQIGTWNVTRSASTSLVVAMNVRAAPGGVIAREQCLTIAAGASAAYECGDLRLVHALPATTTLGKTRAPVLIYNSEHADARALVQAEVTVSTTTAPDHVLGITSFANGHADTTTWQWNDGTWHLGQARRIAMNVRATKNGLTSGVYVGTISIQVFDASNTQLAGCTAADTLVIVDRSTSPYGAGWWLDGLEQISMATLDTTQRLWVGGDGSTRVYTKVGTKADTVVWMVRPALDRPDSIIQIGVGGVYRRLLRNGAFVEFSWSGHHTRTVNALQQATVFWTANAAGAADSIAIPVPSGGPDLKYRFTFGSVNQHSWSLLAPSPGVARRVTVTTIGASYSVASITDPDAHSTSFHGDAYGRDTMRVDKLGHWTTYHYDEAGKLKDVVVQTSVSPRDSSVSRFCSAEARGLGVCFRAVRFDSSYTLYDGPRLESDVADTTRFFINEFGAVTKIVNALGESSTVERTDSHWPLLPTALVQPNGHRTRMTYDFDRALALTAVDSNGLGDGRKSVTTYTWHSKWDMPIGVTTQEGVHDTTSYQADFPRPVWAQRGYDSSRRVTFNYDPTTRFVSSTAMPLVNLDETQYDALGNVKATKTRAGHWTTYARDGLGRDSASTTAVDPLDLSQLAGSYSRVIGLALHDVMDQVTESRTTGTLATGATQEVRVANFYDAEGNLERVERTAVPDDNQIGTMITKSYFDPANRKVADEAPDHQVDSLFYDAAGNVIKRRYRTADVVTMDYDALNRLRHRVTPRKSYPAELNVSDWANFPLYPINSTAGVTIQADVDSISYDILGNIRTAYNGDARVVREYYPNGALKTETQSIRTYTGNDFSQHQFIFGYTYDLDGRRTQMTRGGTVDYRYVPGTGELQSIAAAGQTFTYAYDAAGRLAATYLPGGIRDTNEYDLGDRLIRRTEDGSYLGSLGNGLLHADTLSYDARGRLTNVYTKLDTIAMSYSGLGAITEKNRRDRMSGILHQDRFSPDAFGNLIQTVEGGVVSQFTYLQDGTGRLSQHIQNGTAGGTATTYDSAGNQKFYARIEMLSGSYIGQSITRSYYGADGRLRIVDRQVPDAMVAVASATPDQFGAFEEYRYDALGRRVLKRSRRDRCEGPCQSTIERYGWDGNDLVHEIRYPGRNTQPSASLEVDTGFVYTVQQRPPFLDDVPPVYDTLYSPHYGTTTYTYGTVVDRPLLLERRWYGQDAFRVGDITAILHYNYLGSVDEGTATDGRSIATLGYSVDWPGSDTRVFGKRQWHGVPRSWMGGQIDQMQDASGFQYRRNRYYDPNTGRFTQEDPIGLAGGINLYGFAGGDPVNFDDPFGLCVWDLCIGEGYVTVVAAAGLATLVTAAYVDLTHKFGNPTTWFSKSSTSGETGAAAGGRAAHKAWDPGAGFQKEVRLPSGKRCDALNPETCEIKELKPDNERAKKRGEKQLKDYKTELDEQTGKDHKTMLETYKPKQP